MFQVWLTRVFEKSRNPQISLTNFGKIITKEVFITKLADTRYAGS